MWACNWLDELGILRGDQVGANEIGTAGCIHGYVQVVKFIVALKNEATPYDVSIMLSHSFVIIVEWYLCDDRCNAFTESRVNPCMLLIVVIVRRGVIFVVIVVFRFGC